MVATSACSGKCKEGKCKGMPRMWIVAACEGMISLFEKDEKKGIVCKTLNHNMVFASLEQFQLFLNSSEQDHAFNQLVFVGSNNDIAWLHASISPHVARHITAEIPYPLIPGWFKEQELPHLTNALKNVFSC